MLPPPSKASTVTEDNDFSHASAAAVASKKVRVAGSLTNDTVTASPSVTGGVGSSFTLVQDAKPYRAIAAINSLCMVIMVLRVYNRPRSAAFQGQMYIRNLLISTLSGIGSFENQKVFRPL